MERYIFSLPLRFHLFKSTLSVSFIHESSCTPQKDVPLLPSLTAQVAYKMNVKEWKRPASLDLVYTVEKIHSPSALTTPAVNTASAASQYTLWSALAASSLHERFPSRWTRRQSPSKAVSESWIADQISSRGSAVNYAASRVGFVLNMLETDSRKTQICFLSVTVLICFYYSKPCVLILFTCASVTTSNLFSPNTIQHNFI